MRLNFAAVKNMQPTKIIISPEVREFNEAVENADYMLDYQFDQECAETLLDRLQQAKCYPYSSRILKEAMANLAIKR